MRAEEIREWDGLGRRSKYESGVVLQGEGAWDRPGGEAGVGGALADRVETDPVKSQWRVLKLAASSCSFRIDSVWPYCMQT